MDTVPDDVLLAVLRLLKPREVVGARRVCRRWRDLALHPDLWRHRSLYASCDDIVLAALRLAPCVASLSFDYGLEGLGVATVSTACATADLSVTLKSQGDAVLAVMAIRNQVALGRLKSLAVSLSEKEAVLDRGLEDLLTEIHRLQGLTWLGVDIPSRIDRQHLSVAGAVVPGRPVPASLKECCFWLKEHTSQLRPHWEFQLASHSATLRRVVLDGTSLTPWLQASLFNSMPCLEELECPLVEDMHLLKCDRLRKLQLYPDRPEGTPRSSITRILENTVAFFRGATDLLELDLTRWNDADSSFVVKLVAALASSRRSKLEYLRLTKAQVEKPHLLDLEHFPTLKKLRLCITFMGIDEYIPDSLLELLATVNVPLLSILRAGMHCFHDFLQRPVLKAVTLKNPQLHILTYGMCCSEYCTPCATCAAGGCEETGFWGGCSVGVCAHPADGDADCAVREKHAKDLYEQWFRFPQNAD